MKPVTDAILDLVIDEIENYSDDQYEKEFKAFSEAQPVLLSYFFSDQFNILSEEEQGYLEYLALIGWKAIVASRDGVAPEPASEEEVGDAEEKNYQLLDAATGKDFGERIAVFFEDYHEEELLAFAEDAVTEDEDETEAPIVTEEGKEPIFIGLKTMFDVLTK